MKNSTYQKINVPFNTDTNNREELIAKILDIWKKGDYGKDINIEIYDKPTFNFSNPFYAELIRNSKNKNN